MSQNAAISEEPTNAFPPLAFTIERSALLKALGHLQSVVERRNAIAILSNVLIEAKDGEIALTATDMDIALTETIAANVSEQGSITVAAHMLYDIIRKLPDGSELEIKILDGKLQIHSGKCRFALSCLSAEEFPVIDAGELSHHFALASTEIAALLEKTRFAISNEETRYYLNGIYFHGLEQGKEQLIATVATDGHKLARVTLAAPAESAGMPGVIIPRKTVQEVSKLLDEDEGEVQIALSDKKIRFSFGRAVLISKLIDGTFPDYSKVIPSDNDRSLVLSTAELTQAIDRISIVSSEKTRAVKFFVDQGKVTISAANEDQNEASEQIEANYSDKTVRAGYNARYLLDMLSTIEGEDVTFFYSQSDEPGDDSVLVRDTAGADALYVIMPMHI